MDMLFVAGLLANPFEALGLEWQSIVLHLFNLVVLTVGLYFLLFKPVKRMVKEHDPHAMFSIIETQEVVGRGFGSFN